MGFSLALMASRQVTLNVTLMESDHPVSGLAISQVDRLHVMTIGLERSSPRTLTWERVRDHGLSARRDGSSF